MANPAKPRASRASADAGFMVADLLARECRREGCARWQACGNIGSAENHQSKLAGKAQAKGLRQYRHAPSASAVLATGLGRRKIVLSESNELG